MTIDMNRLGSMSAPAELLEPMLAELAGLGALRSAPVERAFRAVPRHVFTPGVALPDVYAAREVVITKRGADGEPLSSVSAPEIQAFMLEQAAVEPGMSVLEIGSGGCNAALLAELVGPTGRVLSVDIDAEIVARARLLLDTAGYGRVDVRQVDATAGLPGSEVWDRIVVTVGAWDIDPLWIDRLAPGGILVLPLRLNEVTRSIAVRRDGAHLTVDSAEVCGFIPMRGIGGNDPRTVSIDGTSAVLRTEAADAGALAVSPRPLILWTEVVVAPEESFASLELYLAANLPGFALITTGLDVRASLGVVDATHYRPAIIHDGSFGFLVTRDLDGDRHEFGVVAHGATASDTAAAMADAIRGWNTLRPCAVEPTISIWPRGAAELPTGSVIHKKHHSVVLAW